MSWLVQGPAGGSCSWNIFRPCRSSTKVGASLRSFTSVDERHTELYGRWRATYGASRSLTSDKRSFTIGEKRHTELHDRWRTTSGASRSVRSEILSFMIGEERRELNIWTERLVFLSIFNCFISLLFVEDVPLVEFMYLVFTRMRCESYRRQLRSFLLYVCYVFRPLIISLECCYCL